MRLGPRRVAALAVVAGWLVVVGVHVRREYFKPLELRLAEGSARLAPGRRFYAVRMDGRAVGLASSTLDTLPDGFLFYDDIALQVPALGSVHDARVRTSVELGRALDLRTFDFRLESDAGEFRVRGRVAGDSALELELDGTDAGRLTLPLEEDAVLGAALPLRLAASGRLEVGREYRVRLFDPSVLGNRDVTLRVTAHDTMIVPTDSVVYDSTAGRWIPALLDTLPVWRVEEGLGGVAMVSWVDDQGRIVKAESPLGIELERTAFEIARDEWRAARADSTPVLGYGPIIEATAIASNVLLEEVEAIPRLAVRLRSVELAGLDLAGGRQQLRGDTLVIEREDAASLRPGYRLPYRGGGEPAGELEASALVQADDPRIVAAAREAAGGVTDPVEAARRLNDWVYRRLEKEIALTVPSAVRVLEAGRGDCNEHTVLYMALARALGLPARTAVGLVYVRGRFYYHAWPEVWLGRWVAVDPTLGQFPADASHLRFLVGGLARQAELVRLIGRLELEVL